MAKSSGTNIQELQGRIRKLKENFNTVGTTYKEWQQAVETQDVRRNYLHMTFKNLAASAGEHAYELLQVLDLVDAELTKIKLASEEKEVKPVLATPTPSMGYVTGFKNIKVEIEKEDEKGEVEE